MEKYGQYRRTTDIGEVHDKVKSLMAKYAGVELNGDSFVSAVWIENFLSKGAIFLVIQKNTIFDNTSGAFEQITVKSISNIENVLQLKIVTNSGKEFTPFKTVILPKELRPLIVGDINKAMAAE